MARRISATGPGVCPLGGLFDDRVSIQIHSWIGERAQAACNFRARNTPSAALGPLAKNADRRPATGSDANSRRSRSLSLGRKPCHSQAIISAPPRARELTPQPSEMCMISTMTPATWLKFRSSHRTSGASAIKPSGRKNLRQRIPHFRLIRNGGARGPCFTGLSFCIGFAPVFHWENECVVTDIRKSFHITPSAGTSVTEVLVSACAGQ